ncbi:hypothetical protein ACFWPV_27580 [Streptomyces uncialis]|uniref:hypothetical protein n=1 Tax=Streptomyces uncialis TaxID=1048205 RepID=UPI0036591722
MNRSIRAERCEDDAITSSRQLPSRAAGFRLGVVPGGSELQLQQAVLHPSLEHGPGPDSPHR